jgi:hypothetical protein
MLVTDVHWKPIKIATFAALLMALTSACSGGDVGHSSPTVEGSLRHDSSSAEASERPTHESDPRPKDPGATFIPSWAKGWQTVEGSSCGELSLAPGRKAIYQVDKITQSCIGVVPGGQVAVFVAPDTSIINADADRTYTLEGGAFTAHRLMSTVSAFQVAAIDVRKTGSHLLIVLGIGAETDTSLDDLIATLNA